MIACSTQSTAKSIQTNWMASIKIASIKLKALVTNKQGESLDPKRPRTASHARTTPTLTHPLHPRSRSTPQHECHQNHPTERSRFHIRRKMCRPIRMRAQDKLVTGREKSCVVSFVGDKGTRSYAHFLRASLIERLMFNAPTKTALPCREYMSETDRQHSTQTQAHRQTQTHPQTQDQTYPHKELFSWRSQHFSRYMRLLRLKVPKKRNRCSFVCGRVPGKISGYCQLRELACSWWVVDGTSEWKFWHTWLDCQASARTHVWVVILTWFKRKNFSPTLPLPLTVMPA